MSTRCSRMSPTGPVSSSSPTRTTRPALIYRPTSWLRWFGERLAALGLPLTPSVGNFVLPQFPDDAARNADAAFAYLQSRGILTRKMGAYGLPKHLRITIGTGEEMEIVAAALAEFM